MSPPPAKDQSQAANPAATAAAEKGKPTSTPAAQEHKPEKTTAPAAGPEKTENTKKDSATPGKTPAPASSEQKKEPEAKRAVTNTPRNAVLQGGEYLITVSRWNALDSSTEVVGSITPQSLEAIATSGHVGSITLKQMRGYTPKMSPFTRVHRFCTADGEPLDNEALTLDQYFAYNETQEPTKEEKPAKKEDEAEDKTKDKPEATSEEKAVEKDAKKPEEKPADKGAAQPEEKPADKDPKEPDDKKSEPKPELKRPRLQLLYRSPHSSAHAQKVADAAQAEAPAINLDFSDMPSGSELQAPTAPTKPDSMIDKDATLGPNTTGNTNVITPGTLTEEEWAVVMRNCAVMYGWKVDASSNRIVRAPRAAFRLRVADDTSTLNAFVPEEKKKDDDDDDEENDAEAEDEEATEKERRIVANLAAPSLRGVEIAPRGIPNFRTNDDSRIEVTACSSAFAMSLAKSDFNSSSTEASANGGFAGYSASVSVGVSSKQSNQSKQEESNFEQIMVARYMYPRCDLFLRAEDLEPTPEFAELLRKVKEMRSLDALRQIQSQYGSLFCQELTLGARLLSTRTTSTNTKSSVQKQKEQFKMSVGASVQTPYGGGSVKHESENGREEETGTTTTTAKEGAVFEASGGDTILANNPTAWAATVASPALWRVINRDGLAAIVDMLSEMPGYESSQMWFVRAMPALNKYIRLNASLLTHVRFKVESPTNSLSVPNNANGMASFYLGCKPDSAITPRLMSRSGKAELYWMRLDKELIDQKVLFNPCTYRAPSIYGFKDWQVGGAPFGSEYNAEFAAVQWELVSPFSADMKKGTPYELKHGAKIILRTIQYRDPKLKVDEPGPPGPPQCHMVMYRNTQGVFLPAISDSDDYQYWKIEKTEPAAIGTPIKSGDSIRLSWCFEDQSVGMRDFVGDVFGRRRAYAPAGYERTKLYLKVPWPRMEVLNTPTALIASPQSSTSDVHQHVQTLQGDFQYRLQDLVLRIDTVDNKSKGDSNDYMLKGLVQQQDISGQKQLEQVVQQAIKDSVKDYGIFTVTTPLDPKAIWQRLEALGAISAPA